MADVDPKRKGGGLALFSRFPIADGSKEATSIIPKRRNILSAQVEVPGWKPFRVFGVYLTSASQADEEVSKAECEGFWRAVDEVDLSNNYVVAAGDFNKDIRVSQHPHDFSDIQDPANPPPDVLEAFKSWPCRPSYGKGRKVLLAVGKDSDEISYKSAARHPVEGMLDFILASQDLFTTPYKPTTRRDVKSIDGIPNLDMTSDHFPVAVTKNRKASASTRTKHKGTPTSTKGPTDSKWAKVRRLRRRLRLGGGG